MLGITNRSHKIKIRKAALTVKILPYYVTEDSGEKKNFPKQLKIMFYSYLEITLCSLQTNDLVSDMLHFCLEHCTVSKIQWCLS